MPTLKVSNPQKPDLLAHSLRISRQSTQTNPSIIPPKPIPRITHISTLKKGVFSFTKKKKQILELLKMRRYLPEMRAPSKEREKNKI